MIWDLAGGRVVKTILVQGGMGLIPGLEIEIPHVTLLGQTKHGMR